MSEIDQIVKLVDRINTHHKHHLSSLDDGDALLLMVKTDHGKNINIVVSKNGVELVKEIEVSKFNNIVEMSLKDLIKLVNNHSYIIRYLTTGRIKIRGNIKKVLNILQSI